MMGYLDTWENLRTFPVHPVARKINEHLKNYQHKLISNRQRAVIDYEIKNILEDLLACEIISSYKILPMLDHTNISFIDSDKKEKYFRIQING